MKRSNDFDEEQQEPIRKPNALSATERLDMERAQSWVAHINSGHTVGDPSYFDGYTWQRIRDHRSDLEDEQKRSRENGIER